MRRALALVLAALGSSFAGCGDDPKAKELVVGVLLPMTGGNATYGEESWNGMRLAEKEIRAKDPSFAFRLVLNDEQSKKEAVGPQTKALVENHSAAVVVGSVASSNTMEAAIVCKEAGIPILTPASTNDTLTDETEKYGRDLFRICFKDSFQGTMLARFAMDTLKAKKAAALIDRAQAYSVGLAEQFTKEFTRLGGTVESESYSGDDKDYTTLVQKVAATKPDVILMSGYYKEAGAMIRLSGDSWKGIPVIGGDGLDSPELIKLAGETEAKIFLSSHFAADDQDPTVQSFVKKYKDAYKGTPPGAMAALGYDAMYAVHEAAKRAAKAHPDAPFAPKHLADAFRGLDLTGVTGRIVIGPDRTPKKAIVFIQAAGTFKFVAKIQPE